jgi:hypothetical protein
MSKGSKRPSWKVVRNRFIATGRELAAAAAASAPPVAPYVAPAPVAPRTPKPPKTPRAPKVMTEREAMIREWYLYGGADDPTPEGLTDNELMSIRKRFC